jgi:hypothetical protein
MSGAWSTLTEFRELWFPSPRLRLSDLGAAGSLGWKLQMTHIICHGSFHGLIRLEDGRLYPISRDGGEDVFKSSWVHFSR